MQRIKSKSQRWTFPTMHYAKFVYIQNVCISNRIICFYLWMAIVNGHIICGVFWANKVKEILYLYATYICSAWFPPPTELVQGIKIGLKIGCAQSDAGYIPVWLEMESTETQRTRGVLERLTGRTNWMCNCGCTIRCNALNMQIYCASVVYFVPCFNVLYITDCSKRNAMM